LRKARFGDKTSFYFSVGQHIKCHSYSPNSSLPFLSGVFHKTPLFSYPFLLKGCSYMKKPYIKPELTVIKPDSPKHKEILELLKSQQSTGSNAKQ